MGVVSLLRWFCGLPQEPRRTHRASTRWPRPRDTQVRRDQGHKRGSGIKTKKSPRSNQQMTPFNKSRDVYPYGVEAEPPVSALPASKEKIILGSPSASTPQPIRKEFNSSRTDGNRPHDRATADLPSRPAPASHAPSSSHRPIPRPSMAPRDQRRTSAPRPSPTTERMDQAILVEVLETLEKALSHTPYAVCGLAAMAVWGFAGRFPSHVSITCPSYSKEAIKCWAGVHGMVLYPDDPNSFGLTSADGKTRRVRIKFLDRGFESLQVVAGPPGGYAGTQGTALATSARILSLTSLLDLMARGYVSIGCVDARPASESALFARRAFAQDIFWVLSRIADGGFIEEGAQPLNECLVPGVVDNRFWSPFTTTYPGAVQAFARAGLARTGEPCSQGK